MHALAVWLFVVLIASEVFSWLSSTERRWQMERPFTFPRALGLTATVLAYVLVIKIIW